MRRPIRIAGTALTAVSLLLACPASAHDVREPAPFEPGLVSTLATEVRVTFSPDGQRMLWGAIGWPGGPGGWDIYESVKTPAGWSQPHLVSFDSPHNDFDPFFAPDGLGVYFFSNRPGGLGKDDIYFAPFDPATASYGAPQNLGPTVNTAGSEWAPAVSNDGDTLLFSSDGRGEGKQDLFFAARDGGGWAKAEPLGALVNGPNDDFDATFLPDDSGIVMTSGDLDGDGGTKLYLSLITPGGFTKPQEIGPEINCSGGLTLGPSLSRQEPGKLFFSSNCQKNGVGRMDIFRAPMPAFDWSREPREAN